MKVIIGGAGQVGFSIARYLSREDSEVTVIDKDPVLVRRVTDTLDCKGVIGQASHPNILEAAGAGDADMIIAVTHADEVNMVSCQVAHSLFNVTTKIARIRHQDYLQPHWANLFTRNNMPIDVIISPEIEVAKAVMRRLSLPGAFEMIPLAEDRVRVIGTRCKEDTPLINTPLRQLTQLFPDLNIVIVGIIRHGKPIVPSGDDQMLVGDEVFFVVDTNHLQRAMAAFGCEASESRRIVVFGGGNIGLFLAREIETKLDWVNMKLIELNHDRAAVIASQLEKTTVINGNVLDTDILNEANVDEADTVVAITNDDETNVLSALLAKRLNTSRVIALVNNPDYETLIPDLGIDVVVNPRTITVSTILQHVRRGRIHSVHSLREGFGEILEAEALKTSPLVGMPLKDAHLPDGVVIGAVIRDDQVIVPRSDTVILAGDRVVLFASQDALRKVENMFSVRLEYF